MRMHIEEVFPNQEVSYKLVIEKLSEIIEDVGQEIHIECKLFSQREVTFKSEKELNEMLIDFDWCAPIIEISENLVWHNQKNERAIELTNLPNSLMAVSYENSDYCIALISKSLYLNRKISEKHQELLSQISYGDYCFMRTAPSTLNKDIIEFLIKIRMVFIVEKIMVDDRHETIKIKSTMDFQSKNYSIEFTKVGRQQFLSNELGVLLTDKF